MDIGRSFSYVFEDAEWVKKVLIGGVVGLIPIVNFAATGYGIEQTRKVYEGRDLPLPEWDNFGGYFMKGLMSAVATFVYLLPVIAIYCCIAIVIPMLAGTGSSTSGSGQFSQPGPLASLAGPLAICFSCLILLYVLVLAVLLPALTVRYAITGQFGAFFQFGPAWQMVSSNLGGYLMAVIVIIIAYLIAGIVGGIACGIGALFTGFWAGLVSAYLMGNFARGNVSSVPMTPIMPQA